MENNDLNKKVLRRLEEKIAIEEYSKKHNITPKKKNSIFKIACIIIAGVLITGNFYTYATQNKDIVTYVLDKINFINVVNVKDIQNGDKATLILENYGFDEDTLIIGYKLKIKNPEETFINNLFDSSRIVDGDDIYGLERAYSMTLDKINDTEYEAIATYNFDTSKLNDKAVFETKIYLPKYLDVGEHVGEWEFKIPLDTSQKVLNYDKYKVENKRVTLEEKEKVEDNANYLYKTVSLLEVKKSDMVTKFCFLLESYLTGGEIYTVEILDENGQTILKNNVQKIFGGKPTEIVCKNLDFNSKITINIYEMAGDEVSAKGSLDLDLSKDLKQEEKKKISYTTKKWHNLKFRYNEDYKINISEYKREIKEYYISFELCKYIGDYTEYEENIVLETYEDKGTMTLEEMAEFVRTAGIVWYGANAFQTSFPEYSDELGDFVYLNRSQILELAKNGEVIVNGVKIDTINNVTGKEYDIRDSIKYENIKTTKIKDIDAITWTKIIGREVKIVYMFIYKENVYELEVPSNIGYKDIVKEFIDNIELN